MTSITKCVAFAPAATFTVPEASTATCVLAATFSFGTRPVDGAGRRRSREVRAVQGQETTRTADYRFRCR